MMMTFNKYIFLQTETQQFTRIEPWEDGGFQKSWSAIDSGTPDQMVKRTWVSLQIIRMFAYSVSTHRINSFFGTTYINALQIRI